MAFLSASPGIDEKIKEHGSGSSNDIFSPPAFREHILKAHGGNNPLLQKESPLESAAAEGKEESLAEERENPQKRDAEKIALLYGSDKGKGGEASSLYHSGHAAQQSGNALTCCNTDFFKDGSSKPHDEKKETSYATGPGAPVSTSYVGSRAGSEAASHLYKK